ncbi:MAG: ATP-binding protein [Conexivisphaerales archaeon]
MNIEAAITRYIGASSPSEAVQREVPSPLFDFVVAVVGPRRAGKTTYMLQIKKGLKLPEENKIFLNCEDINLVGIQTDHLKNVEDAMLRIYSPSQNADVYLFIDEVQNMPDWEKWLRTLYDSRRYKIVVSGSTSELTTQKMHSALRGRAINTLILPFSFSEFLSAKGVRYSQYMPPHQEAAIASSFDEYIAYGGYPSVVLSSNNDQRLLILQEIFETVIQRDIIEKYRIKNTSIFKLFINSLLGSVGRQFSIRKMTNWLESQGVKVGRQTLLNYLEAAEDAFLLYRHQPYSKKPRERHVKPKLYVVDSGILSLVTKDYSKQLENQVFVELLRRRAKMGYWQGSSGREVDFVIENNQELTLLQVAYSLSDPVTFERETSALREADNHLHASRMLIITKADEEKRIQIGAKTILVLPAWKWFLNLSGSPGSMQSDDPSYLGLRWRNKKSNR